MARFPVECLDRPLGQLLPVDSRKFEGPFDDGVDTILSYVDPVRTLQHTQCAARPDGGTTILLLEALAHVVWKV